jgi:hypothetical protein
MRGFAPSVNIKPHILTSVSMAGCEGFTVRAPGVGADRARSCVLKVSGLQNRSASGVFCQKWPSAPPATIGLVRAYTEN